MIPIDDQTLYADALLAIKQAIGNGYLGRAAQMFLGCKHYGDIIPRIGASTGIATGDMERLLDELFIKEHRLTPEKIVILFDDDHKVPSGKRHGGLKYPSNIWRNNLNIQKPYICYASVAELQDRSFLLASRKSCPHLLPEVPGTLAGASCALMPTRADGSRAKYRGEDNPKMFRKDTKTSEYTVHDPGDIEFYSGIVIPENGNKLPVIAIIVVLYFDSVLSAQRTTITIEDFLEDFNFSAEEAAAYFEDDPASDAHAKLIAVRSDISWERIIPSYLPSATPTPLPGRPPLPAPQPGKSRKRARSARGNRVTKSAPPPNGVWWDAEQAVRAVLEADGWTVIDMSPFGVGYDYKIIKSGTLRLIEVKSSIGPCAPTMTELEYQTACGNRTSYVMAMVEHFDPTKPATIEWVYDPAFLGPTMKTVIQYFLPRSLWKKHTFPGP